MWATEINTISSCLVVPYFVETACLDLFNQSEKSFFFDNVDSISCEALLVAIMRLTTWVKQTLRKGFCSYLKIVPNGHTSQIAFTEEVLRTAFSQQRCSH